MKKITFLFSVLLLCILNTSAQRKGFLSLSVGPSLPLGDYGSVNMNNDKAAFATTGHNIDLGYATTLGKNIGIAVMYRYQANPFDEEAFETILDDIDPSYKWTMDCEDWTSASLMLGLYGSFPIDSSHVSFEMKAMFGYYSSTYPGYKLSAFYNGDTYWIRQDNQSAGTLGYLIGAGFKFNVGERVCILLNADYSAADLEFERVTATSNIGLSGTGTIDQKIQTFNVTLGVGLGF
jgi:hypothetical protein